MSYPAIKRTLLRLLRAPAEPPAPPAGSPDSVQVFRATSGFLTLRLIEALALNALLLLGAIVGLFFVAFSEPDPTVLVLVVSGILVLLATLGLTYFLVRLDYDMRYYIVTDRSLRIRQGALIIQEVTLTFANIQNLTIRQGPLERLFGFANLVVHTAGGGTLTQQQSGQQLGSMNHRGILRGIANAREVRDTIADLLRAYRDSGLGDPEETRVHASPALPALRPSRASSTAYLDGLRAIRDEAHALRDAVATEALSGASDAGRY